jgi:hypothetical protein
MIGPAHEQAQNAPGAGFFDSVSIDFSDPEDRLFCLGWMTRRPNAGSYGANLVLFVDGDLAEHVTLESNSALDDWNDASLDGILMTTRQPLERWTFEASGKETSLAIEAEAVTAARVPSDETLLERAGIEQYEQLCGVTGRVEARGRKYDVNGLGRRVHCWGTFGWSEFDRWRSLYAVSASGRAVSVLAVMPSGSKGHGEELRVARLLDEDEPRQFEDVYLSTVYGRDGLPSKAGLELWTADDELPHRFGGEAICAMRAERPDHELTVSFFRWSIDGEPAYGCYEVAQR